MSADAPVLGAPDAAAAPAAAPPPASPKSPTLQQYEQGLPAAPPFLPPELHRGAQVLQPREPAVSWPAQRARAGERGPGGALLSADEPRSVVETKALATEGGQTGDDNRMDEQLAARFTILVRPFEDPPQLAAPGFATGQGFRSSGLRS